MISAACSALVRSALAYHLGRGVVLGEERQDRAGALGTPGHVMLLQDRVVAVVADGVEVAVEPVLAGGQPQRAQRLDEPGQEFVVGVAAGPPGGGAQGGGRWQAGAPEGDS